ncbi:MAG: glycoside hydrolase family 2 TIM barrel-domain containing protein [Planctomycetota bacterium]|jgi:beta-glucuronidase
MKNFKIIVSVTIFIILSISCGNTPNIVEERGGRVKVVKYYNNTWQLLVDEKPYFIKGVVFVPVKIGEDPGEATMRDWMYYDDDNDGKNDIAYQTWLDKNKNNKRDFGENIEGDFKFLKDMGCNTIRLYHVASNNLILGDIYKKNASTALQFDHSVNKELLRRLYKDYGIMVIMGNFLGAWTIGSGASWEEGTDYANSRHRANIKKSVQAMILDNKDEPYVLMWLLGNENNIATWSRCNAQKEPEAYAKLVGELAEMIHELDPKHPVAVCDGDNFNTLRQYAKHAQAVDIIAYNSYRGKYGFGTLWKAAKSIFDRPIFISEFGMFSYNTDVGEDENLQLEYIRGCWRDIVLNSAEYYERDKRFTGNSLGGVIFDWVDRWYMDGTPYIHNEGFRNWDSPDGLLHEEWFGIMSKGDGSDSLMRQKRKTYDYFKDVWSRDKISF